MTKGRARALVACLAMLALSGCMGTDGDDASVADLGAQESADETVHPAVIEGRVVTQGFDPLEAARVVLHASQEPLARATTSSDGAYRFEDVPPGEHGVRAMSGCCVQETKRVEAAPGDSVRVNFVMAPLSTDDLKRPYVEEYEWVGLMACGVGILGGSLNACILDPNDDSRHVFEVREGVRSLSVSVAWDASLTASERLNVFTRSHCKNETQACDGFGVSDSGPSPMEFTIFNEDIEDPALRWEALENGTWMLSFSVWPDSELAEFAYEQEFTVHYHVHYWQDILRFPGEDIPRGEALIISRLFPEGDDRRVHVQGEAGQSG